MKKIIIRSLFLIALLFANQANARAIKASHGTEIHRIPIKDFLNTKPVKPATPKEDLNQAKLLPHPTVKSVEPALK